jgi:hypothetical protein
MHILIVWENANFLLDCSIFVFSLIFERGEKYYCVNLMKFTVAMQHIAWLKWYKIQKIKRCLKGFFSLNLINVISYSSYLYKKLLQIQLKYLNWKAILLACPNLQWIIPFVTTIFSDLNIPYIPLHCGKITISTNFLRIFIYLRYGGNLK